MKRDRRSLTCDEDYILDLCDELLGCRAERQRRFSFLRGDSGRCLPVDAFYPALGLVIEYRERQHFETVSLFDRRPTVSGMSRGEQRARYDQLRRDVLREQGIHLIELNVTEFPHNGRKRLRRVRLEDLNVLRQRLADFMHDDTFGNLTEPDNKPCRR